VSLQDSNIPFKSVATVNREERFLAYEVMYVQGYLKGQYIMYRGT